MGCGHLVHFSNSRGSTPVIIERIREAATYRRVKSIQARNTEQVSEAIASRCSSLIAYHEDEEQGALVVFEPCASVNLACSVRLGSSQSPEVLNDRLPDNTDLRTKRVEIERSAASEAMAGLQVIPSPKLRDAQAPAIDRARREFCTSWRRWAIRVSKVGIRFKLRRPGIGRSKLCTSARRSTQMYRRRLSGNRRPPPCQDS